MGDVTRYEHTVGRYMLFGAIGAGGMATVHIGRRVGAGGFARLVAIKRLHPHLAEEREVVHAFLDEARIAARVTHPNVVSIHDVVLDGAEVLLVMEYVPGRSLSLLAAAELLLEELPQPAKMLTRSAQDSMRQSFFFISFPPIFLIPFFVVSLVCGHTSAADHV